MSDALRSTIQPNPSVPILDDASFEQVARAVQSITKPFADIYEKVNYPGYISVLGAALTVLPLLSNAIPWLRLGQDEQRLYVFAGAGLVVVAGAWICLQNFILYRMQRSAEEVACRMLAIKVAAMGETQRAALEAIGQVAGEPVVQRRLIDK